MLYIGFSIYSHKIHSQIFCHKYKHCAPVVIKGDQAIIYQFVHVNKIKEIIINKKDLNILKQHGWKFIKYHDQIQFVNKIRCLTCVQFTKQVCGIKNIKIQTPDALLRYIK
jgi:hypothetical protein